MLENIHKIMEGDYSGLMIESVLILSCWTMMIVAVFIDLWTGVERAKKCGKKMKSNKFRLTLTKIGNYWRVMIFGLFIDAIIFVILDEYVPFGSILFTLACCFIEAKSVIENLRRKKSVAAQVPEAVLNIIKAIDKPKKLKEYVEILNSMNTKHDNTVNHKKNNINSFQISNLKTIWQQLH